MRARRRYLPLRQGRLGLERRADAGRLYPAGLGGGAAGVPAHDLP